MKKRILVILMTLLLAIGMSLSISAIEGEDLDADISLEESTEATEGSLAAEDSAQDEEITEKGTSEEETTETSQTIFTRLWEYVTTYKTEILGFLGDAAIFIVALLAKNGVSLIKRTSKDTNESQVSVVGVVNEMVDGYNALRQSYEMYGATEDDRNRVVGALVAQNTAILEILTTVYVNSKNLPQGVKDLVNLKYAKCLKALDNDEQLKAIVMAVRENIGTNKSIEEISEDKREETGV